jgi:2-dehydropantoate 2-reductase
LAPTRQSPPFGHVAVIGPGAIGCVLAVRLALAPHGPRVTLLDHRADRAARLSARPIVLHTAEGDLQGNVPVRTAPEAPPDLVILATKAGATSAAARAAAGWIGGAPLLAIQNGLGVVEAVAEALPRTAVCAGVLYQAANVVAEGDVRHVANERIFVGRLGREAGGVARRVAALLASAGLPASAEDDILPQVWGKALVNAALNPVAALAGVRNGEVASRAALAAMAEAIADESQAVAEAEGVGLPYASAAEATLETARCTAENRCSMLQDLEAGRPTEIEFLNGALVRAGERRSVATPANLAVTALARQVSKARGDTQ